MSATSIFNRIAFGGKKKAPAKQRIWYYKHSGESQQTIDREGKWWMFHVPEARGGGRQGADSLRGAKVDLLQYEGTKVWSELI